MEKSELAEKLRKTASILPSDVYTWLHPVLTEAADEIERLEKVEERYENAMSAAEDHRWD